MLDMIFGRDAPEWVHLLFGQMDKEITKQLKTESALYLEKMRRIRYIYAKHPEFIKIMESDNLEKELILSIHDGNCLSELIMLQIDIMGMYQKMYFYKGFNLANKLIALCTKENIKETE